jgi:hypothetical protein
MKKREFVHKLMGRPGRLDVAAWVTKVARDDYFNQRDAVKGVGDNQGEVRSNLEALSELGLLEKTSPGRPQYRRIESPVWRALEILADAVSGLTAGEGEPKLEPDEKRGLAARQASSNALTMPTRHSRTS